VKLPPGPARLTNWFMWRLALGAWKTADVISPDGNRSSAVFARLGMCLERRRIAWFPEQFEARDGVAECRSHARA